MAADDLGRPRPRRLSLPLTFSPSVRRRSHRISQPPLPPPSSDKALPPIPFAHPPFMPMYKPPTATSPARLVKNLPSPRAGGEAELWTAPPVAYSPRISAPTSPKLNDSRVPSGERSRFMRRLNRWTASQRELDFGCAGEWSEGPADFGDRFYSAYPGGANRASTTSSVDVPSLTHSRGASTSSTLSVSTAASSVPPSPTLACHPDQIAAPLSPYTSRVPLTPRTAQRKRQSDEDAAVDALNDYFSRVRLSQIEEVASPRASLSSSAGRNSLSAKSVGVASDSETPMPTPPAGLAIFGGECGGEISFEKDSLRPPRQKQQLHHSRSVSHDLEIEFIETGHTTFTPLHVDDEAHDFPSTFILPDDAFVFPSSIHHAGIDTSPSALSTFAPTESTDSCETMTTGRKSITTGESNETSTSTILRHRSPVPEHAFDSTLDELSHYFGATSGATSGSSASSSSSSSAYSSTPPPTIRHYHHAHHASLPSLLPPTPISPLRKHRARFGSCPSQPSSARLGNGPSAAFTFPPTAARHQKRESASFAAAQRARLVQAGQASPLPSRVTYDWI
ncbi:hypothetical protein JCM6882_004467 [Rhodosporidiobolus microsporus]